jgi:hypothetical protein
MNPHEPHTPPEATSERLAMALAEIHAPASMIAAARAGLYDDYKSKLAAPILALVADLRRLDTPEATALAQRALNSEFDGTRAEAEQWAQTPEGQNTFREFGMPPPMPPSRG